MNAQRVLDRIRRAFSLQSIRGRLALVLAAAFLPAGVIAMQAGIAALSAEWTAEQQVRGGSELQGLVTAREDVARVREVARALASNPTLYGGVNQQCSQELLTDLALQYRELAGISVIDAQSRVICSTLPSTIGAITSAEALVAEVDRTNDVALAFIEKPNLIDEPIIAAVAALQPTATTPRLYVGVVQRLSTLLDRVGATQGPGGTFTLVANNEGRIYLSDGALQAPAQRAIARTLQEDAARLVEQPAPVGRHWAVAVALIEGNVFLVRGWTPAWLTGANAARAASALLAPLLLWAAAVGAAWYLVEIYCSRPLVVLERLARGYANAENTYADEQALSAASEEIVSLRDTLAQMFRALRERELRLGEALLEERALLREVNHRVKNNLQMVASILSIQARGAVDVAEARGLARAQERVQLLALAHTRIYASGEVRGLAVDELAADIARTLASARGAAAAKIAIEVDLAPGRAPSDRAVPFAFLVGESLSEALDAFEGAPAQLKMSLSHLDGGGVCFELRGSPHPSADQAAGAHRLIDAFARQIGGEAERAPREGLWLRFTAPDLGGPPEPP